MIKKYSVSQFRWADGRYLTLKEWELSKKEVNACDEETAIELTYGDLLKDSYLSIAKRYRACEI